MDNQDILKMVEEKWGEYLEVLPLEQRFLETINILCNTIRSLQQENTFLSRLKGYEHGIRNIKC